MKINTKKSLIRSIVAEKEDGDTIDKIWLSYVDPKTDEKLTPVQRKQKERIENAYVLLKNYQSIDQVAKSIQRAYHNVSIQQAYMDCEYAIRIFGDFKRNMAEGMNWIMYELATKIMQKALDAGDLQSANKAWQNAAQALGMYEKNSGVIAPEDIESHTYVLQIQSGGRPLNIDLDKLYQAKPEHVKKAIEAVESREEMTVDVMAEILDGKINKTQ